MNVKTINFFPAGKVFLILLVFLIFNIEKNQAVPLDTILKNYELPATETLEWTGRESPVLSLLPDAPGSEEVQSSFLKFHPELTVQRLYRLDLPEGLHTTEDVIFALVNTLCDAESQTGYTYHSHRRDEDTELIEESYRVDRRDRRTEALSFTDSAEVPQTIEFRQYIKEANFRGTTFEQTIHVGETWVRFVSRNEKRLWFTVFPLIKSEGLRSEYFIFLQDGQWYIYGISMIREMPGLNDLLGEPVNIPSLYRKRMDVSREWMGDQLGERLTE